MDGIAERIVLPPLSEAQRKALLEKAAEGPHLRNPGCGARSAKESWVT